MNHEYDSVSDFDRMSQCQAVILCPEQNSTGDRCTSVSPNLAQIPYFRFQCIYIYIWVILSLAMLANDWQCKVEVAVHHVHVHVDHVISSFIILHCFVLRILCICACLSWDLHGTGNQRRNAWNVWNFRKCLESSESSKFRDDETFFLNIQRPADANSINQCVNHYHSMYLSYSLSRCFPRAFLALGCGLEVYCFIACQQNHWNDCGHPSAASGFKSHACEWSNETILGQTVWD